MADINTSENVLLTDGDACSWDGVPVPFRFAADRKTVKRLMRNCEDLQVWVDPLNAFVHVQKGPLIALLDIMQDHQRVACTFNGRDCVVYGFIDVASMTGVEFEGDEE